MIEDMRTEIQVLKRDKAVIAANSSNNKTRSSSCTISKAPAIPVRNAYANVQIETSPVRESQDECLDPDVVEPTENNYDEIFNPHASETDGYDTLDDEANAIKVDYSKILCADTENDRDDPIIEEIAQIVTKKWNTRNTSFDSMKKLFEQFKSPKNCILEPPKVNPELWKLLNSFQRKRYVKFSTNQKSIIKAMNGVLKIFENINKPQIDT